MKFICILKILNFSEILGFWHVVSEHKVQTLGLDAAQLAFLEQ